MNKQRLYLYLCYLKPLQLFNNTPSATDPVVSIFSPGFRKKNITGSANFSPGCPFLSGRCFAFFKHTQMSICWVCKSRTVEATNWPGKTLIFHQVPRRLKFSLAEGKKIHCAGFHWVCHRGVFTPR